ncbi:hypothetical protein PCE1_004613 [Barthelona sp. PCE]
MPKAAREGRSGRYTCSTCHMFLNSLESQHQHYKSEIHQHNLNLATQGQPPITEERFQRMKSEAVEEKSTKTQRIIYQCNYCRKTFSSKNAYTQHCQSRKHLTRVAEFKKQELQMEIRDRMQKDNITAEEALASIRADAEADGFGEEYTEEVEVIEKVKEYVPPELTDCDCIFCTHTSENFEANLAHMHSAHSFYVPALERCLDLGSVLQFVVDKVVYETTCLHCHRNYHDLESVRHHMRDCHHCMFDLEGEDMDVISEFYEEEESNFGEKIKYVDRDEIHLTDGTVITRRNQFTKPSIGVRQVEETELVHRARERQRMEFKYDPTQVTSAIVRYYYEAGHDPETGSRQIERLREKYRNRKALYTTVTNNRDMPFFVKRDG